MKSIKTWNKHLSWILLAQCLLAVLIWWPKPSSTVGHPSSMSQLEWESVRSLSISSGANDQDRKNVLVEKADGKWTVPSLDYFPADEKKIAEGFNKLKSLSLNDVVVSQVSNHKKLQVSDDYFQRRVVFSNGQSEHGFYLGSSPQFRRVHVRDLKDAAVFISDGVSAADFSVDPKDWIEKSLVDTNPESIDRIEIVHGKKTWILTPGKKSDEKTAPGWLLNGKTVKPGSLDAVVRTIADLRLTEVFKDSQSFEGFLKRPYAVLKLTYGAGEKKEKVIVLGKVKEGEFIAKSNDSKFVVGVAPYQVSAVTDLKETEILQ